MSAINTKASASAASAAAAGWMKRSHQSFSIISAFQRRRADQSEVRRGLESATCPLAGRQSMGV